AKAGWVGATVESVAAGWGLGVDGVTQAKSNTAAVRTGATASNRWIGRMRILLGEAVWNRSNLPLIAPACPPTTRTIAETMPRTIRAGAATTSTIAWYHAG